MGPEANAWFPDLSIDIRNLVSMKSINILVGEGGLIPESLSVFPFPSLGLKGLIKSLEIKDETRRGGVIDSSLTVLYDEANDPIFYKYIDNFKVIFNKAASNIVALEEANAKRKEITDELKQFHSNLLTVLNELYEVELAGSETEAFPKVEKDEQVTFRFKIIVCGDPSVGKTSTVLRFTDNAFKKTYIPTMGVNVSEKRIQLENARVEFIIWDIAGQSKFQMMRKHFYQGAEGKLLIFDLTRPKTFNDINKWYQDINSHLKGEFRGFLLGNKSDLVDQRKVTKEEISKLAKELNIDYIETSALSGENINNAFHKLGHFLVEERRKK
ncbi:MAG: GTP-binding protein [Candidatus Helarchaeota archaeon]|nr:GTP-binding protein [Candidatus Helarchaeota archaeon]